MEPKVPIVDARSVSKIYGAGETSVTALTEADLKIHAGELMLIQGPSGSGKTTLLSILGLLLKPTGGGVWIGGEEVTRLPEKRLPALRASTFGFIFQGFNLFPALTALENVALALKMKGGKARVADEEAARLLHAVGPGRSHAPRAGRPVGRAEAARGDRARAGGQPAAHPGRRADGGARLQDGARRSWSSCAR